MAADSNVTPLHPGVQYETGNSAPAGLKFHANKSKSRAYSSPAALFSQEQRDLWPFGEMTTTAIARLTGTHPSTVRRWQRTRRLPHAVRLLGHILMRGDLGAIDPTWDGWRLHDGELIGPGVRHSLSTNALEHFAFSMQRVAALESTIRRLEATIAALKSQQRGPLSAEQRRSRAETLKAIGRAELFMKIASVAESMLTACDGANLQPAAEKAHTASRAAAGALIDLYERTDPETGRAYYDYMGVT